MSDDKPYTEVAAGLGLPPGGTTGQVLVKASNADFDFKWVDYTPLTPVKPTVLPVPNKAAYWVNMGRFSPFVSQYQINNAGKDFALLASYYDGQLGAYRLADHFQDKATYHPRANRHNIAYSDYYVAPNVGKVMGNWIFAEGLVERFIRQGDAVAKVRANLLLTNAAYSSHTGGDPIHKIEYARDVAYNLETHIHVPRIGVALTPSQLAWRNSLFGYALGHLDSWINNTGAYCRPFMVGIVSKALIDYWERVSKDIRIKTKLISIANYIWDKCWLPAAVSFRYTDRETGQTDNVDSAPQHDLNMLIAPIYGWLWSQTGNPIWRTRGDQIFSGAVSVYSGNERISGADLGQPNALYVKGKQYNQQLYWGPRYIEWAELPVTV